MKQCFIIAEAGVNHNGALDIAFELIKQAAQAGADAVKFQSFKAEKLVRRGAQKAAYQTRETGAGDQYSMLQALEISDEMHHKLVAQCERCGIEFMSTPFDEESADFLVGLGMKRIKIPSGEITNHPFLAFLATKNLPLILSTGMSSLTEIEQAVNVIANTRQARGFDRPLAQVLTLLHCTSNYPADLADVNLRAMNTIGQATQLPVGYSDHTAGVVVSVAAVALGATVVEKHFTLDHHLPGPDHKASLEPAELQQLIQQIRSVEKALGSAHKEPVAAELPIRDLVRRSVTTLRAVRAGEVLHAEALTLLRPGTGIAPADLIAVTGRIAKHDLPAGTTLTWDDLE